MNRIAAFVLLIALSVAGSIPAQARRTSTAEENERQYQKHQKMLRKANKKQRKAMKKYEKAQRKAMKKANRHRSI